MCHLVINTLSCTLNLRTAVLRAVPVPVPVHPPDSLAHSRSVGSHSGPRRARSAARSVSNAAQILAAEGEWATSLTAPILHTSLPLPPSLSLNSTAAVRERRGGRGREGKMERVAPPFPSHRVIRGHGTAAASAVGRRVKVPRASGRTDADGCMPHITSRHRPR